jgi:hypothetical protein
MFLDETTWRVLLKYLPVRFLSKKKARCCEVCGGAEAVDNKFELSHRIPFARGIKEWGLLPEFLNSSDNLVTAHKRCNKKAELSNQAIGDTLRKLGCESVPTWLPERTQQAFRDTIEGHKV